MLQLDVPRFSYDITKWYKDNVKQVEASFSKESEDYKKLLAILTKQCEYKIVVHKYLTSLIQKNKWIIELQDGTIINGGDFKEHRDKPIKNVSVIVLGNKYTNQFRDEEQYKSIDFAVRIACEHDAAGLVDAYYKLTTVYDKFKLVHCVYCNGETEIKTEYIK